MTNSQADTIGSPALSETGLPAPLVPADVDLRDFAFMPLDVRRLRDSRIAASATGEEFRAAVLLWCASWHQLPAGSLPDDDTELAQLAGFGRVTKEWKKLRAGALHGWLKASDGRLYHPVVAEKANESWQSKLEHSHRRECDRLRKENKRLAEKKQPELPIPTFDEWNSARLLQTVPAETIPISNGIPAENALKGEVRDREYKGQGYSLKPSEAKASGASAPPSNGDQDPASVIFSQRVKLLTGAGVADGEARSVLGKARKAMGDKRTAALIGEMALLRPPLSNPVAYLMTAAKGTSVPKERL